MAKYLHRIGAKHIKFDLEVVIHYLKLTNTSPILLKIRVHRGKDKVEETQVMQYSPNTKKVQFDYPLSFQITMYKKSGKYSKKDLLIKVLEIQGKSENVVGTLTVEFHKIAEIGNKIQFEEYKLADCKDSGARLCMSVDLSEHGKSKAQFSTGNLKSVPKMKSQFETAKPTSNPIISVRRAMSYDSPEDLMAYDTDENEKFVSDSNSVQDFEETDTNRSRTSSVKTLRSAFVVSQDILDQLKNTETEENPENSSFKEEILQVEEPVSNFVYYNDEYNTNPLTVQEIEPDEDEFKIEKIEENFKASEKNEENLNEVEKKHDQGVDEEDKKQTVNENYEFLNVDELGNHLNADFDKDFEDSSSSEEVPEEIEVVNNALYVPITDMKESEPNAASQELRLNLKEREAGLPESRKNTCCGSCIIY